jgi:5'-methylthioadenosine phosphorylase
VRRSAAQGLLARGHRVQGVWLLPDRQPWQGAVWRIVLVLGREGKRVEGERVEGERVEGVEGEELVFFLVRFVFVFVEVGRRLVVLVRQLRVVILGQFFRREGRLTAMTATAPEDAPSKPVADIGVIGGSGFYEFLTDAEEVTVETPFGAPSEALLVGQVEGRRVAFLPRHGKDHRFPPHKIPYRANMWALRALGVRRILAPSAVGSLTASYGPGTLAIPDQLVDRTGGRAQSYYDEYAVHVPFADPYCPSGRAHAIAAARRAGWVPAGAGTLVVIDGPRFSTRAESRWYAAQGWTLVGMTGHPEAVLARELAMCYTTLALVTDTDAGVQEGEGVTQAEVFEVFGKNMTRLRELVVKIIAAFPEEREDDLCAHALDGIRLPIELP